MSVKPKELLKTGMIVISKTGKRGLVLKNASYLDCQHGSEIDIIVWDCVTKWAKDELRHFNDDLIDEARIKYDDYDYGQIDKIICRNSSYPLSTSPSVYITVWERQQPKEMTIAEIEQALGYPIKVVNK